MILERLSLSGFRLFESLRFSPGPTLNLITGGNGAGKTTLLEAVYYLGRGRSFRTRRVESVTREGCSVLRVVGRLRGEGRKVTVGVERNRSGQRIRIDGRPVSSASECARVLPVQVVHPNSHRLLEEGPRWRRHFLDWGVFHVEPRFHGSWKRYADALRQRNSALRGGRPDREVSLWDEQLIRYGEEITAFRQAYVERLAESLPVLLERLGLEMEIRLGFQPGWRSGEGLKEGLRARISLDRSRGFTGIGPQRADLLVRAGGRLAREVLSRGQQKVLVLALILTQALLHREITGRSSLMLLDDLAAELDRERRDEVIRVLEESRLQCLLTSTDPEGMANRVERVFHVEQGAIERVI